MSQQRNTNQEIIDVVEAAMAGELIEKIRVCYSRHRADQPSDPELKEALDYTIILEGPSSEQYEWDFVHFRYRASPLPREIYLNSYDQDDKTMAFFSSSKEANQDAAETIASGGDAYNYVAIRYVREDLKKDD
jgi:hypothetical protein